MSQVDQIIRKLKNSRAAEIISEMDAIYERISAEQKDWYQAAKFLCPSGCGTCCHNFEPDLLEVEALYMAAWLLQNKLEVAEAVAREEFPFENGKTCIFHDYSNPYHCTIYGGRAAICRLFGAACSRDKNGQEVWKPCKFIPLDYLKAYDVRLDHKQYNKQESAEILGKLPPVMSDFMEQILSIMPENHQTYLVRDILPLTIRKLMWLIRLEDLNPEDPDTPNSPDKRPKAS